MYPAESDHRRLAAITQVVDSDVFQALAQLGCDVRVCLLAAAQDDGNLSRRWRRRDDRRLRLRLGLGHWLRHLRNGLRHLDNLGRRFYHLLLRLEQRAAVQRK